MPHAGHKRDGSLFAVLFLDLDRFKVINDSLGHSIGDALLIGISKRLGACVRGLDTVARDSSRANLVRLGGDEFVILLENISGPADAIRVAERVHQAFVEPFQLEGREIFSAASIGIAIGNPDYRVPDEITCAMPTRAVSPRPLASDGTRFSTARCIRPPSRASTPKTSFATPWSATNSGFTTNRSCRCKRDRSWRWKPLVRWEHPERGMIQPSDFIPVAEETGLIAPIGQRVLREACSQLRRWEAQYPWMASVAIAVNISGKQLAAPALADDVRAILTETGLAPQRLHLEITESAAMGCATAAASTLRQLDGLNLELHLDDFGTGYSSLSYLHRMPVDVLKIDRLFVGTMMTDAYSHSIVTTIVALAHTLKLRVIAEGVETQEQAAVLRAAGCDDAQGYLFAAPLPASQVMGLLNARRQDLMARSRLSEPAM